MRKRIFAVVMAVVVAVGCVGYRPQKAYANAIALSSEGFEVLFGLLGSAGVVVGIDKTVESRFQEGQKLFDSLSSSQQQSYIDWLAAGEFVTSDTGHRVFQPDMELDTSWYRDLWNDVKGAVDSYNSVDLPLGDYSPIVPPGYKAPKVVFGDGLVSDSAYFVANLGSSGYFVVYSLPNEGTVVSCNVSAGGSVSSVAFHPASTLRLYVEGSKSSSNPDALLYSIAYSSGGSFFGLLSSVVTDEFTGIRFATADGLYGFGSCSTDVLSVVDGALVGVNELIDCDTWVSKWDDAKAEGRQVGIITGQDLSGYNTLDDIYNPDTGLVTGLDIPTEIPVTPDLTGIAGVLSNILSWLKSLPRTIVGQGALDFSKFNNIALSGVFPFCIPFDLINVFKSFNGVQPIEPKWVIDLSATPLKAGGQIVLDLTQFGVWVSIIRYFCYASFVVGLILITRKVIKG